MDSTATPTTVTSIDVTMFTVADVDAAVRFYTEVLGWEVRTDIRFGAEGENRWLEVAPAGSTARVSLNPPVGNEPGHSVIGVGTDDVFAEHRRLGALGVEVGPEPQRFPGAPTMFSIADPDGNQLWIVSRD